MTDLVSIFLYVYRSKTVKNNFDTGLLYFIWAVLACFVAKGLSDRTFSALITLSAAVQCLGFCFLRAKIRKQRGVAGISSRSVQLFAVMYVFRLFSTLQYNGYLPVDRSGDWVYQSIEVVALLVTVSVLAVMHGSHEGSYERDADTLPMGYLLVGAVLVSCCIHPHLNNRKLPDIAWTSALYLEAVAMMPQMYMLVRKGGEVESLCSHYIACCFLSRCLMLGFWLHSYAELRPKGSDYNLPGYGVLGAQLLQIVLFADFMYHYVKSWRYNTKMMLPSSI